MERPKLGDKVSCHDQAYRHCDGGKKIWKKWADVFRKPKMIINGTYVGYRTAQDGYSEFNYDYTEWHCTDRKELWLVVIDPRHNPIRVFPEDTVIIPPSKGN